MMQLNSKILAIIIIGIFILGIGGSMAFNLWHSESTKIPALIKKGEFAGLPNPSDIRGSYSFEDINKAFAIPVNDLATAFGVKTNKANFQCKKLEEIYANAVKGFEIGTDSVRLFSALYLGRPHTPEDTTALPRSAVDLLIAKSKIKENQAEELKNITFDLIDIDISSTTEESSHEKTEDDRSIRGKTTFYDLMNWGLSQEEIETVLGDKMGPSSMTVRDWVMNKGHEFADFKNTLQDLIDKKEK